MDQIKKLVFFAALIVACHANQCWRCICEAQSEGCKAMECSPNPAANGSLTCGFFQITEEFYTDCDLPSKIPRESVETAWKRCANDYSCSTICLENYWHKFKHRCSRLQKRNCEQLTRIFIGGPSGCETEKTDAYWSKIHSCRHPSQTKPPVFPELTGDGVNSTGVNITGDPSQTPSVPLPLPHLPPPFTPGIPLPPPTPVPPNPSPSPVPPSPIQAPFPVGGPLPSPGPSLPQGGPVSPPRPPQIPVPAPFPSGGPLLPKPSLPGFPGFPSKPPCPPGTPGSPSGNPVPPRVNPPGFPNGNPMQTGIRPIIPPSTFPVTKNPAETGHGSGSNLTPDVKDKPEEHGEVTRKPFQDDNDEGTGEETREPFQDDYDEKIDEEPRKPFQDDYDQGTQEVPREPFQDDNDEGTDGQAEAPLPDANTGVEGDSGDHIPIQNGDGNGVNDGGNIGDGYSQDNENGGYEGDFEGSPGGGFDDGQGTHQGGYGEQQPHYGGYNGDGGGADYGGGYPQDNGGGDYGGGYPQDNGGGDYGGGGFGGDY